jgi:hypothetical protein
METVPLPPAVLELAVHRLPDDVKAGLMAMGPRAVVAGGYLRSLGSQVIPGKHAHRHFVEGCPKDIDIFVPNVNGMSEMSHYLQSRRCVGHRRYAPGMLAWRGTLTFKQLPGETPEVQVVGEWPFENPAEVIENFDFSVSAAALWWTGTEWAGAAWEFWAEHMEARVTSYLNDAPNPAGTLLRLPRYIQLGYHVSKPSLTAIAVRSYQQFHEWYKDNRQEWRESVPTFSLSEEMYRWCEREMISPPADSVPYWEGALERG